MDKANLAKMLGKTVRVDRGGPESRVGKLLSAKDDHFVVYIENEGLLYYKNDHIKSFSVDTRDVTDLVEAPKEEQEALPKYLDSADFNGVLQGLKYRWIQINRGGPEKIEGVLVEASDDKITLIKGEEIVQLVPFHIRSISYGVANSSKESGSQSSGNSSNEKSSNSSNGSSEKSGNSNKPLKPRKREE